jgi:tetratricopeptide (TPR) repeat protein
MINGRKRLNQRTTTTLGEMGHHKEALVYFDKALELNPSSYYALNAKGIALTSLGDYRQAVTTFDEALNANEHANPYSLPDASVTLFNKAFALLRLGQQTHAITDIHLALQNVGKSLAINPDDKSAQGLRMSLRDLLAWEHGDGQG